MCTWWTWASAIPHGAGGWPIDQKVPWVATHLNIRIAYNDEGSSLTPGQTQFPWTPLLDAQLVLRHLHRSRRAMQLRLSACGRGWRPRLRCKLHGRCSLVVGCSQHLNLANIVLIVCTLHCQHYNASSSSLLPYFNTYRLAGGAVLFNTTEPSTPNYQLAYVPDLMQLAFMTPLVRHDASICGNTCCVLTGIHKIRSWHCNPFTQAATYPGTELYYCKETTMPLPTMR